MALSRSKFKQCAEVGRTIEQLKDILSHDPVEVLMLAAGQHGLNVAFIDVLQEAKLHTFICSVEVGNLLEGCMGYGPTKMEAKMNAAEEAITELVNSLKDLSTASSPMEVDDDTTLDVYGRIAFTSKRHALPSSSKFESKKEPSPRPFQGGNTISDGNFISTGRSPSSTSVDESRKDSSLYQSFLDRISHSRQSSSGLASRGPSAFASSGNSTSNNGNPVGTLQELAAKKGLPAPVYEEVDDYGEDHRKTFVIQCKFRTMVSEGIASTKKTAKRQAAEEMLTLIGQNGSPAKKSHASTADGLYQAQRQRSRVAGAILGYHSTSHVTAQELVPADYHRNKLEKLASKKKWTIEWRDLETGSSGNSLCFVRIKTATVTVCGGSGPTKTAARDDAARNALKILQ